MKINLKESLNKIDLATNNKYDLLNTFNSKNLSDNNKKKLAEAIENNSIASINRILHESEEKVFTVKVYQDYPFVAEVIDNSIIDKNGEGKVLKKFTNRDALDDFANELISKGYVNYQGYSKNKSLHESEEQLFKVVIQSGATKRDFESDLYENEAEEIVDYYGGRWIDENGFEWDMYVEEDDQLTEASYGGAYDIEDDMFFTKEEIVEFVEEICEYLGDIFGYQYDINNVYMDGPRKLYINIYDNNYIEVESTFDIDMRRIRKPSDLSKVYGLTIKNWFQKAFAREYRDAGLDESLTEDTVKQNGKWVNKGSEGTHGKFRTKKAADAQRKAMFANGYKAESLNEQKYSSGNYFLTVDETGMGPHYSLYYQHPHSGYDGLMFIVDGYGYDNFKEKLSKFSTVYPNKDVQNLLKNINENKSNDESLSEKLIPAPQEVVDELLSILEKYDFVLDDSLRHPIGKTWYGNTHVQVINKDSYMEETDDPDIYFEELKEYVSDEMENEIDMLSDRSDCRITYNFGINKNWQVTGGLDVWEKYVPGLQDESLKEQVNLPGYAVRYTTGYSGNGVNNSKTEWFRTEEERDRRVKELKDKNYIEIKTWKMDNFYHTLPKNESLNEAYEYLYNQPFLKTFDEFVSKVSGLKADELDDEVWNEYFHEYQVYNEKYKVKDFENKLRKSLEEKDLEVISIEPNETATLVTVKFDGTEKKFRFKFRLFDVNDYTEEYYIDYIVSMIAGYFGLNESLKEDYKKLFGYNILSSTLKDGGDTYALLRKTEDGKTKWAATKYVNGIPDEDNIFEITYEQARGFEPLTDTGKVSKKLGKALLPKKESLKEDLSDLDLILNTPADTKQFNEETFRALKNLVSEYKKDLDSLDQWASESEKEPFVKKWYKLADKCQEIAKNGIRGITGYGRLKDAIKLKVVDLARSVDNTFPWYTKNRLEKFGELEESLTEDLDFFDIVDNIPLNVLNDDICQGDVFTGFYFNSEESANRFANYLERKGFTVDQSEDSSYVKGFNYKVSVFDNIEGKYFDDETYDESLNEAYGEDLSDIQEIKQLDFVNRRVNNLRGIFSVKDFVNALNSVGLDSFKIRTSRLKNISSGDLKDAWYSLKKNGWTMSISHDSSLDGFNEVYVFSKIKNESLKEDFEDEVDLDYETDFDEGNVEEGNVFTEGGVDYAWIEREAGPIYLDFDKWAVWSAREYVDPREFITLHDDGEGYDFDSDAFEKKAMVAPIVYFVVEEDTGFIDWGPEDNEIAAKDFLNSKKEDWENDMDESLNEDKELREYYAVNLHYEDIGDGREYDYKADYDDVLEYLIDYCVDEDDAPEDTQEYMEWVVNNFDSLLKKYEYDILEYFYEDASQEEYDERNRPYEPEYDPMSDEV